MECIKKQAHLTSPDRYKKKYLGLQYFQAACLWRSDIKYIYSELWPDMILEHIF